MQSRYAKDKVQFVAISLDDPRDAATRTEAGLFLGSMKPGFPTYYFADSAQALQGQFPFEYLPCIFVIDKSGNIAALYQVKNAGGDAKTISQIVEKLETK